MMSGGDGKPAFKYCRCLMSSARAGDRDRPPQMPPQCPPQLSGPEVAPKVSKSTTLEPPATDPKQPAHIDRHPQSPHGQHTVNTRSTHGQHTVNTTVNISRIE